MGEHDKFSLRFRRHYDWALPLLASADLDLLVSPEAVEAVLDVIFKESYQCLERLKEATDNAVRAHGIGRVLSRFPDRTQEAKSACMDGIALDPQYAPLWWSLGRLLEDSRNITEQEEAVAAYRKAISLDPGYVWAWTNLGVLLSKRGEHRVEAEAACRQAISLDPNDVWAWIGLGMTLGKSVSRYAEAEAAYQQAISLDPNSKWAWGNLGLFLTKDKQRNVEAEAAFRHIISLDPGHVWAWTDLGHLLSKDQARYAEADAAYCQAIRFDPKPTNYAWNDLGLLWVKQLNLARNQLNNLITLAAEAQDLEALSDVHKAQACYSSTQSDLLQQLDEFIES